MRTLKALVAQDPIIFISILISEMISILALNSIAPSIFPLYYLFIFLSLLIFALFTLIDFKILAAFYWHFYVLSILFLLLPPVIGQITRGAIRWVSLGPITIQPSEIARPFLMIFFAVYATKEEVTFKRLAKLAILTFIPIFLILIQPSLGVSIITLFGILGIILASKINRKLVVGTVTLILLLAPLFWFMLAPYQRQRISGFVNPEVDTHGAGYNSIQAMISVGSGKIFGRGLGEGIQTQLEFLPEKHTDFIFAAIAEELGIVGAAVILISLFFILWRLGIYISRFKGAERAFIIGIFCVILAETTIHIGMNMGILPITGLPLPLVSAGGSALLATSISLAIAIGLNKTKSS